MADSSAPRILGRYALHDRLASGGMASVHLGRLLGPVGFARTVAIKRLHPEFAGDPEFVAMFLDEARLVARISHPNVVPTLDVVAIEGELFIVMEYIRGEALAGLTRAARKRGARITPAMAATIMVGALYGLHAAHEAKSERGEPLGIVHRDISPQNILVGVDGVPRVLDFGVAKAVGRVHSTREGQIKGKLAYMSPEQAQGSVSRATDVYAAGVVLWELLASRYLFATEHEAATLMRVLQGCTEPPSKYEDDIPPALDAVVLKALRVDPAERYATAREMARALEEAIQLVPTSAVGEWVEGLAYQTLSRRGERIAAIESDPRFSALSAEPSFSERPSAVPAAEPPVFFTTTVPMPFVDRPQGPANTSYTHGSGSSLGQSPSVAAASNATTKPAGKSPIVLGVVSALGSVVIGVFLTLWLRPAAGESGIAPVVLPSAAPSAASTAIEMASTTSRAQPTVAVAVEPTPIVTPEPVVTAKATSTSAPRTTGAARPVRPSTPPKNCNPPYSYDSRGVKVFKKECL